MPLKRPCKNCSEYFLPTTRHNKLCIYCLAKAYHKPNPRTTASFSRKRLACPNCHKTFKYKYSLNQHIKDHSNPEIMLMNKQRGKT